MSGCQHDHDHHHHHHSHLDMALILTALFATVEFVGGWISNSLALLADAVHMTSDVAALAIASMAARIASRPAHSGMSFGYGRARVLAAQANGVALWFLSGWIVWEATHRLMQPPEVQGGVVIGIGLLGLILNVVVLKWLHGHHDLNSRAAYWHVMGDLLGSVAAVIAGVVIYFSGWMPIDPILSFLVAMILAWGGWQLLNQTTRELMEATPAQIDPEALSNELICIDGIVGVHHIHIWKLPGDGLAISAHIEVEEFSRWGDLLPRLQACLKAFGIHHVTLQPESSRMNCHDSNCCVH